jgi:hypothetical protein
MDVVLLASKLDTLRPGNDNSHVGQFNAWLQKETGNNKLKFESCNQPGVFTILSVELDKDRLLEAFRSIKWFEPDITAVMIREIIDGKIVDKQHFVNPAKGIK